MLLRKEDANLANSCFYLRAEKDDNKVILEDKDLEVIGTPSVQYDDTNVIIQHIESGLWLSYKTYQVCCSFSYVLSCSTDQTTNSESTNPEFGNFLTNQIKQKKMNKQGL